MANPYQYTGKGEGFLTDYSNLAAVGAAFNSFGEAYQKARHQQSEEMERTARVKSMADQQRRAAEDQALKEKIAGVTRNQTDPNGPISFNDIALTAKQQYEQSAKSNIEGVMPDPDDPTKAVVNPASIGKMKIDATRAKTQTANTFKEETQARLNDAMDRREHERILTRVNANPVVKGRLQQSQNLDNALRIITDSDSLTPQQVMEFQQAVRSNLGIKGTSGVGEREETYFKTAGLNAANWKQFITGDPADIAKDSKLLNHFKQLALIEQKNVGKQFDKALNAASSGHGSMYQRREDLKQDLKDALESQREQMQEPASVSPDQAKAAQPQSFMSRLSGLTGGLVMGQPASASPKPKTIQQGNHTYTFNPLTGKYE